MFTSLFAATPPNAAYAQSVSAVTAFANWIESQTLPGNSGYGGYQQAANVFSTAKIDTMQWINAVYPSCIQISQQIEQADGAVTPDLNTLLTLAAQLQSEPGDGALQSQIVQAAQSLNGSVTALANSVAAVVRPLQTSGSTIAQDTHALSAEEAQFSSDWRMLSAELGQLYGQLHALQNATCPNRGDIANCEAAISNCQNAMTTIQNLGGPFGQSIQMASSATQGLSFMASYWSQVQNVAQGVIQALGQVSAAPVAILKLDLTTAQQGWNQTVALAQATNSQIAAMNFARPAVARSAYAAV